MIFLDSCLIIAYSNEIDENHAKAIQILKDIENGKYGTPVISDYIFDEIVTVMLIKTKNLMKVAELGEILLNATLLIKIDDSIFNLAWKIFKEQQKPKFSFIDSTSIAICKMNGISKIATFDKDFEELKEFNIIGIKVVS
jgi:predicted nucleic acid-binding protein